MNRFVGRCVKGHRFAVDKPANEGIHSCPICGARLKQVAGVRGRVTDTKCGARCTSAMGPNCDCECGGKNHGADHMRAGEVTPYGF